MFYVQIIQSTKKKKKMNNPKFINSLFFPINDCLFVGFVEGWKHPYGDFMSKEIYIRRPPWSRSRHPKWGEKRKFPSVYLKGSGQWGSKRGRICYPISGTTESQKFLKSCKFWLFSCMFVFFQIVCNYWPSTNYMKKVKIYMISEKFACERHS